MAETLMPSSSEEPSSLLDIDTLRRRVENLSEMQRSLLHSSEAVDPGYQKLMQDCFADLQNRCEQIDEEEPSLSALRLEDLETYVGYMEEELSNLDRESKTISDEIGSLMTTMAGDSSRLESDLLWLENSLRQSESQGSHECQDAVPVGALSIVDHTSMDYHFKKMELDNLIEKTSVYVSSLEDIQYKLQRKEAMEQVEDTFSHIEVMDFEGNCIRLNLKTCIKPLEESLQKFDSAIEPTSVDHELLIEVIDGTMELKNLKAFPSDVSLDDIIDSAKSSRYSLQRIISHVQQKIRLCTLRRLLFKIACDSRYSVEYMDRDGVLTAHLAWGIDVHIKVSQGWPISSCALQLISMKSSTSDQSISWSVLCRIKELANSLDMEVRWDLNRFINSIEEILIRESQSALKEIDNKFDFYVVKQA